MQYYSIYYRKKFFCKWTHMVQSYDIQESTVGWDGSKMRRRFKREGTYVYLWLIHVDIWQKTTKFCKAIILQLKK